MKILYISGATGADYQCDIVMHGLRSLLGPDLVDVKKMWFMYDTSEPCMFHSLYKLLPDIEVNREDIQKRIDTKYFDAVVYGSVHRCRDYIDSVLAIYPANRIAFIDGEDGPELAPSLGHGWYFKREIYAPNPDLIPIQFGIPKEKIRPIDLSRKTRLMSPLIPGDYSTYLYYGSEKEYYDQYSDSYFARTRKKGGWDAMRHHEILAAGCIPYFEEFDECPPKTLYEFSRVILYQARKLHDRWDDSKENKDSWMKIMPVLQVGCLQTTEDIAKRVLDRLT